MIFIIYKSYQDELVLLFVLLQFVSKNTPYSGQLQQKMQQCLSYLLSVAQKIVYECADKRTIDKYLQLKSSTLGRYVTQSENSDCMLSSVTKFSRQSLVKTVALYQSSHFSNRMNTKRSVNKAKDKDKQNEKSRGLSRARIQSYSSRVNTGPSKQPQEVYQDDKVLMHVFTVLKNAQLCPNMLKTITFSPNSFDLQTNTILSSLSSTLSSIYLSLSSIPKSDMPQLIKDNRWLIDKLESLIQQNSKLRRIIGQLP